MATEWYYSEAGQKRGPISSALLKEMVAIGDLKPETLIWKDGLSEWVPARNVKGLFPVDVPPPPPPPVYTSPPQEPKPPPIQDTDTYEKIDMEKPARVFVKKAKEGRFARGALWVFYGWSGFCTFGVLYGLLTVSKNYSPSYSEAGKAGQAIGFGCGMFVWFILWAVIAVPTFFIWYKGQKR